MAFQGERGPLRIIIIIISHLHGVHVILGWTASREALCVEGQPSCGAFIWLHPHVARCS
jgi:hypothetical protein